MEIVYVVLAVIAFCAVIAGVVIKLGQPERCDDWEEHIIVKRDLYLLYEHLGLRSRHIPAHTEVVKFEPLESLTYFGRAGRSGKCDSNVSDALRGTTPKSTKKRA